MTFLRRFLREDFDDAALSSIVPAGQTVARRDEKKRAIVTTRHTQDTRDTRPIRVDTKAETAMVAANTKYKTQDPRRRIGPSQLL
jgi:hypothetical protein